MAARSKKGPKKVPSWWRTLLHSIGEAGGDVIRAVTEPLRAGIRSIWPHDAKKQIRDMKRFHR